MNKHQIVVVVLLVLLPWILWVVGSKAGEVARRASLVAVGTPVTRDPPHRSQRAELPHSAPTSGCDAKPVVRKNSADPQHPTRA